MFARPLFSCVGSTDIADGREKCWLRGGGGFVSGFVSLFFQTVQMMPKT